MFRSAELCIFNPPQTGFMKKERLILALLLIVVIPIGFYTKVYNGPAEDWVGNSMGGLVYELFWCLVLAFLFPGKNPLVIALWVFGATCFLEFLQLWHPPFLENLRSTFIGRTVLGHSFNAYDFPYYFIGCLMGWGVLVAIKTITRKDVPTSGPQ
jgi:hypothetical protein